MEGLTGGECAGGDELPLGTQKCWSSIDTMHLPKHGPGVKSIRMIGAIARSSDVPRVTAGKYICWNSGAAHAAAGGERVDARKPCFHSERGVEPQAATCRNAEKGFDQVIAKEKR
jgi:hypothetical protein